MVAPGETGTVVEGVKTAVEVVVTTTTEPPGKVEDVVNTEREVVGGREEMVD